jgi:uncharacterized protein YndB with AHSA1/START domain
MSSASAVHDLVLQRVIDVPPHLVWRAWTDPDVLMRWFTPAPWRTVECEIDLRPGGMFRTVMQSPEGETFPGAACYLEVVPNEKLVWTSALLPGFRPSVAVPGDPPFTAMIMMAQHRLGTDYVVRAMHADEAGCSAHEKMGFYEGWGAALDQLVAAAKQL